MTKKRILYCDVRAVSHSCDVFRRSSLMLIIMVLHLTRIKVNSDILSPYAVFCRCLDPSATTDLFLLRYSFLHFLSRSCSSASKYIIQTYRTTNIQKYKKTNLQSPLGVEMLQNCLLPVLLCFQLVITNTNISYLFYILSKLCENHTLFCLMGR